MVRSGPMFGWRLAAILIAAIAASSAASARPLPIEYKGVSVSTAPNARIPLSATVRDEAGDTRVLGALLGEPTVLVFADFTCRTLCGPAVAFVAAALEGSGLRAKEQFRLLVIGLDPKDSADDAANMRRDHIGDSAIGDATTFLTADAPTIRAITSALGYAFRYDTEADQYVHPAAVFVLRANGDVSRVLTAIGLSGEDMRLALIEANEGRGGTFADKVRLLCSAFDPAHGTYTLAVSRALAGLGVITTVLLAGGIGWLALAGRRTT